ncbi:hypothetical protein ACFC4S_23405 [Priestia megaterium]|uniref:hypothetical protein n=1 Tax=Priestia megaterium TaxID=1404 RepID=UPI0035DEC8C6
MNKKPVVVDRGIDEVLIINNKAIKINYLSGKQLIELLNRYDVTDINTVSFDEYEATEEYKKYPSDIYSSVNKFLHV